MGGVGGTAASLVEGSVGCQSRGSIIALLPVGSPGSTLGSPEGIIKPGRVVLAFLVGVMWALYIGKFHLLTGCKEQGINSSHLSLGAAMSGGLF